MCVEIKKSLKEIVMGFIETQPGYNQDRLENISITNKKNMWSIIYGENLQLGIAGIGESPEKAFENFITMWKAFKGFEWINKTKML